MGVQVESSGRKVLTRGEVLYAERWGEPGHRRRPRDGLGPGGDPTVRGFSVGEEGVHSQSQGVGRSAGLHLGARRSARTLERWGWGLGEMCVRGMASH